MVGSAREKAKSYQLTLFSISHLKICLDNGEHLP